MTRRLTALFSAFEAVLVVAIGVAIPLVPLTILWATQFGFQVDWVAFWRAAVDTWLIGHGVDVTFTLDPTTVALLGIAGSGTPVVVTIAALGFAVLTVVLGARAGTRIAETGHRVLGPLTALAVFAVLSGFVTFSTLHPAARPSIWQGVLLPTLVFGIGLLIGMLRVPRPAGPDVEGSSLRDWIADWNPRVRASIAAILRGGIAAATITIGFSAIATAVLFAIGYARIITLYESLHVGLLGGIALTAAQLAFVPNLVIWTSSWFIGPGFAIGVGSHVSPIGTALGPLPAIPIFGALPAGDSAWGFLGLIVPIVAGFLAGALTRPSLSRALARDDEERDPLPHWPSFLGAALGGGLLGGLIMGVLAAISGGSAGPGRFSQVGPDALAVGLAAAIEFAVGLGIGLASGVRLGRRGPKPAP